MGGGELLFTFVNVMLMTIIVAALVLWRYRRAVLAGMQHRVGAPLPLPPPRAPAAPVAARLHRRVGAGLGSGGCAGASSSARSRRCSSRRSSSRSSTTRSSDLPFAPANLFLSAAVTSCVALPIYALLTATPLLARAPARRC